jgi:ribonuclease HII
MSLLAYLTEGVCEAGCDEAGRGCLAGPVVAAAVILPLGYTHPLINDSKKLTERMRYKLAEEIKTDALAWAIGIADNQEIDKVNILQASILSMHRALDNLSQKPEFILVDGNKFKPYQQIQHKCIIGGDALYTSIAAASVLAKTHRDTIMEEYHNQYPQYQWNKNKGYPTKVHQQAVRDFGPCPLHRLTFGLLKGFGNTLF